MAKFASDYYILRGEDIKGPTTADRLRELAKAGKLRKTDGIRRGEEGDWLPAGDIDGLFEGTSTGELLKDPFARMAEGAANAAGKALSVMSGAVKGLAERRRERNEIAAQQKAIIPAPAPVTAPPAVVAMEPLVVREPELSPCPFCHELIVATAKKCRHCGEILDVVLRAAKESSAGVAPIVVQAAAPAPVINITNTASAVAYAGCPARKRWSRLMAMFLSFLLPGLGQLYKGQAINAFVWFVLVVAGYALMVVPGLVLHFFCVCGAGMGDPYA